MSCKNFYLFILFSLELLLSACSVYYPMRTNPDHHFLEVDSNDKLNYVTRSELKNYAKQIIVAHQLDAYCLRGIRRWKIPPIEQMNNPAQKLVSYVLLELNLASIDDLYFNIVPSVSFYRKRQDIANGVKQLALDSACMSTFRTVCPVDNSVVVNVCLDKCADGGVNNLQMTSSINDHQRPLEHVTQVEALGFAMENLFKKMGVRRTKML